MLNLVLALIGIFALIVVVGRLLHRYFIYMPDRTRVDPKDVGLQGVEEVVFKAADGTKLIAWYRPARGASRRCSISPAIAATPPIAPARSRRSPPTAMACSCSIIAAMAARRAGRARPRSPPTPSAPMTRLRGLGVAPHDIVAYGESLGTAVATRLALQRRVEGARARSALHLDRRCRQADCGRASRSA